MEFSYDHSRTQTRTALSLEPDARRLPLGLKASALTGPSCSTFIWDAFTGEDLVRLTGHRNPVYEAKNGLSSGLLPGRLSS